MRVCGIVSVKHSDEIAQLAGLQALLDPATNHCGIVLATAQQAKGLRIQAGLSHKRVGALIKSVNFEAKSFTMRDRLRVISVAEPRIRQDIKQRLINR